MGGMGDLCQHGELKDALTISSIPGDTMRPGPAGERLAYLKEPTKCY